MEENAAMLNELCQRAAKRHITLYSHFLNLAQQREGEIAARRAGAEYCLYGGAQDCERRMLAVSGEEVPDESLFPIACLLAAPRSTRFAAPIAHRDVLGALMGLGIERELIGDIVLREAGAYIFCVERMADFICQSLVQIGRTDVRCERAEPPQGALRETREVRLQVSSPRLDAIAAHLFHLSRGDAQQLFRQGRVMVDDAPCERPDYQLRDGQVISVRGYGRAQYLGVDGQSKKGKDVVRIALYS